MITKLLKSINLKIKFTENDELYKDLKLSDYGLDDLEGVTDNNFDVFWVYRDRINPDVYNKFIGRELYLKVVDIFNKFLVTSILSVIFLLLFLFTLNFVVGGITLLLIVFSLYFKKRTSQLIFAFEFQQNIGTFFKNEKT